MRSDDRVRVWTTLRDGSVEFGTDTALGDVQGWAAYVAGVVWSLRQDGHAVPGIDLVLCRQ